MVEKHLSSWAGYRLAMKLKKLKLCIKDWAKSKFGSIEADMAKLLHDIQNLDIKQESGMLTNAEAASCLDLKNKLLLKVREEEI